MFTFFKKEQKSKEDESQEEIIQGRFASGYILKTSTEVFDSTFLGIPIDRIIKYQDAYKVTSLKNYFSEESEIDKIVEQLPDKIEWELYENYVEIHGVKKEVIEASKTLNISLSHIHLFNRKYNLLSHFIELFSPNSKQAKEWNIEIVKGCPDLFEWQNFVAYKNEKKDFLKIRRNAAEGMMKRAKIKDVYTNKCTHVCDNVYNSFFGNFNQVRYTEFSSDKVSFFISVNNLKDKIDDIVCNPLTVYYYFQYGIPFLIFNFSDKCKFIHYLNIKCNTKEDNLSAWRWATNDSDILNVWFIDADSCRLSVNCIVCLNTLDTIKNTVRITQKNNNVKSLDYYALKIMNEKSIKEMIQESVYSETFIEK